MSKKKFYVLQSDADTLPAEMKGAYTGDEFPEYKGAETITFNNKTYINGLDYQTVKSGKHVRIEECPICNRLSIIYARGVCKACAQRTLYRHRRDKTGDVMTERNIREANIAFRKGWPVNIICGLDGVRYNIDDYPYSKKEEARIVDAILAIRDTTVTDYLLKHYKDGIKYAFRTNVFLTCVYNDETREGAYGIVVDMGDKRIIHGMCGHTSDEWEYGFAGAIEAMRICTENNVKEIMFVVLDPLCEILQQNADGLRWGYSYTRSQFTKAIDVLKREAAIGFIPEHVESEFQDLAETIAKTLVFPVND